MRIEDRFSLSASRERVWQAIRNLDAVASCLPGCREAEVIRPTGYKAMGRLAREASARFPSAPSRRPS